MYGTESGGKDLGNVKIARGIFQGDSLSPLLFVLVMIPLTIFLRKEKFGYRFTKDTSGNILNHLLFMDDLSYMVRTRRCWRVQLKSFMFIQRMLVWSSG